MLPHRHKGHHGEYTRSIPCTRCCGSLRAHVNSVNQSKRAHPFTSAAGLWEVASLHGSHSPGPEELHSREGSEAVEALVAPFRG